MTDNLRESFRIEPDSELEAELTHEGRSKACTLENMSAGGARLTSTLAVAAGSRCLLGVRLVPGSRGTDAPGYVRFRMEVLEVTPRSDDSFEYRLRSVAGPGSKEYEAAAKLVFATQRERLSRESGVEPSSPMVADPERRRRLRTPSLPRFSKRSLRPGVDE